MTNKTAFQILGVAFVVCLFELFVYFTTGMPKALNATGLSMVAAYKFLWLIILTGAAGILAPVASSLENLTGRKISGWAAWIILVGLAMVGFTLFSFLSAPSKTGQPTEAATSAALPPEPSSSKKIGEVIELVDSHVGMVNEKINVSLVFKNKSDRGIKEISYAFSLGDKEQILLSINMRDVTSIPAGLVAESRLEWIKPNFKDPAEFEKLSQAVSKGGVKVSVSLESVVLDDGTEVKT